MLRFVYNITPSPVDPGISVNAGIPPGTGSNRYILGDSVVHSDPVHSKRKAVPLVWFAFLALLIYEMGK